MKFSCILISFFVLFTLIAAKPVVENDQIVFQEDNELGSSEILKPDSEGIEEEIMNLKLESGKFFQGDIVLSPDQEDLIALNSTADDDDLESRTGILLENQRWTKNQAGFATLPYTITTTDYCKFKILKNHQ